MIRKLSIKRLFDRFDYEIVLKTTGTTIITGPNGFGKSTILKIIDSISTSSINYFFDLQFEEIQISFDNNKTTVIKSENDKILIDSVDITPIRRVLADYSTYKRRRSYIRRTPNGYMDMNSGTYIDLFEIEKGCFHDDQYWNDYIDYPRRTNEKIKDVERIRNLLIDIEKNCGSVKMISEQRLIKRNFIEDEIVNIDVVNELPNRLKSEISKVSDEYSKVANKLDSSYPSRLFATHDGLKDNKEYEKSLSIINKKFDNLNKYNLVTLEKIANAGYTEEYSKALKIYFEDFDKKYQVFAGLIKKLDLFTQIINNRLQFKEIIIDRENGFIIRDSENHHNLTLKKLSSGEKQEIVLFYDLIFNADKESLLLIDEPEISLHVSWQKMFMDDLLNVAKETGVQSIIATHSPQILSKHLDIQIDLGEMYKNGFSNK